MGSAEEQGRLWGAEAGHWAELQEPQHGPLFEAMLDAVDVDQGCRLLDIGCGAGFSSGLALQRGAGVTGLDAAAGMIDRASANVPGAEFHVGDMQDLPFESGSFDVVFAGNSVQYATDLVPALKELGRVCAPGGRIVAGLFGPAEGVAFRAIFGALKQFAPPPPPGAKAGGPFALSEPGLLEEHMRQAGLDVLTTASADCPFRYPDFETFYLGAIRAPGPGQRILEVVEEDVLRSAMLEAVRPFTAADGSISIAPNIFTYVVTRP